MYISHLRGPHSAMCVIKRAKRQGFGEHFGLLLPNFCVIDFGADTGIRFTDLHTFSDGKDVVAERVVPEVEHVEVYERLRLAQLHPAEYNFWNWNCETFVNFLVGEEPRSDQARLLGFALALAAAAAVAARAQ
jgi:hypothetical protein